MSCENHKKEVAGISDMKVLAEMIENLHYEVMAELFYRLAESYEFRSFCDSVEKKYKLSIKSSTMNLAAMIIHQLAMEAWQISKPFMEISEPNAQESDTTGDQESEEAGAQK